LIKIGRKGKFAEWLTDDGLSRIFGWARDGLTEPQIAQNMGVSMSTLSEWKNRYPAIVETLKRGKEPVDIQVENALLKRALGYDYEETVTEVEELSGGRTKKHVRKITKHVAPDVTAQIFWLKNRKPKQWRDRVEQAVSIDTEDLSPLVELLRDE
jgi:transcriptional regulator with XRE-family HTH domain